MEGDVLTGETIRLVPVVLDEAAEWLAGEDEEQIRWFDAPRAAEMPDVIRAINEWQASWRDMGPVRHWGIRPLDSNLILGGVEVRRSKRSRSADSRLGNAWRKPVRSSSAGMTA